MLEEQYSYRIGGKDLDAISKTKPIKFIRLTEDIVVKNAGVETINGFFNDKKHNVDYSVSKEFKAKIKNNLILLNCIDTNSSQSAWIKAEDISTLNRDCLVGKNSSRNIAYVMCEGIEPDIQRKMIEDFNQILNKLRSKYNSLFLTNFRDNDRKRISFDFCNKLLTYCWTNISK